MGNNAVSNPDLKQLTARLDDLENKVAFQDDTIEQLNAEITTLSLDNSLLKRQLKLLADKMKETKSSSVASESEETPPPHY